MPKPCMSNPRGEKHELIRVSEPMCVLRLRTCGKRIGARSLLAESTPEPVASSSATPAE